MTREESLAEITDAIYEALGHNVVSDRVRRAVEESLGLSERNIESRIMEAWGRLLVDYSTKHIVSPQETLQKMERLEDRVYDHGERTPELLTEIEQLTEELK